MDKNRHIRVTLKRLLHNMAIFSRRKNNANSRSGVLFDIWQLLDGDRHYNEAIIRGLCRSAYLGDHTSICRVLGRYKMFVDTQDVGITSHLLLDGFWEMWLTEAMLEVVKPGMTALDIGANLGYFTLLMAELTGPSGKVLAFEPNPAIASRLRRSIDVNGYGSRATVHEVALGATEGDVSLIIPHGEPKNAYVVPYQGDGALSTTPIRRLDSISLDADVVKIDVEGSEEAVWAGMTSILERNRPLTVFLEFTPGRYASPSRFLDEILSYGFRLETVSLKNSIVPISREAVLAGAPTEDQMLLFRR